MSNPLARGHRSLVMVPALVGGQHSIESHAQLHQVSATEKHEKFTRRTFSCWWRRAGLLFILSATAPGALKTSALGFLKKRKIVLYDCRLRFSADVLKDFAPLASLA